MIMASLCFIEPENQPDLSQMEKLRTIVKRMLMDHRASYADKQKANIKTTSSASSPRQAHAG